MVDKGDLDVVGNSFHPLGNPPVDTSNTFNQLKAGTLQVRQRRRFRCVTA
jgi:hypothetical protein